MLNVVISDKRLLQCATYPDSCVPVPVHGWSHPHSLVLHQTLEVGELLHTRVLSLYFTSGSD